MQRCSKTMTLSILAKTLDNIMKGIDDDIDTYLTELAALLYC